MTPALPPRPDFTQLKHQAKDLLRAHTRGDAGCCILLRRLRRFDGLADAAILAEPLALHEAQFALAMDYGFASWDALKRYVEKVSGRAMPLRREKSRTYVAGLEGHGIGCKDAHDNSVIACLAGVMAALGEDFSYPYLMGVSGAAFRVQMHVPDWCPSAACAGVGYDCIPGAMAATGYRLRMLPVQHAPDPQAAMDQARPQVIESLQRGAAVLSSSEEASLVVGYDSEGRWIVRPYESPADGYEDSDAMPWLFGLVEPCDLPLDRRVAVVESLRLALTLAQTERYGDYLSGFAALEHWSAALLDDARFDALTEENWFPIAHGNGYCYPCLWSARLNAERYLREVAELFDSLIRSRLLELAELYRRMHQGLDGIRTEVDCIWSLQPWRLKGPANWTRKLRQRQSELLSEHLQLERQAAAQIEAILPLVG